jgi:hypothetical protein
MPGQSQEAGQDGQHLGGGAGLAILGLVGAALAAIRSARRPPLTVLREL